ncbi:MAG: guanylate kinase [Bacteroidia bacterium]
MKALLLTGPSGSGKTTLARLILERYPQFAFSISATTRPPRPGEVPDRDYYFLSSEAFEAYIQQGEFIEWEELFGGHRYGTLRRELERLKGLGKIPLFVKDVRGTLALRHFLGEGAYTLFILPPSLSVLRQRLVQRGIASPTELEERLARAEQEIAFLPQFDFVLYNDELEAAIERIGHLLHSGS